MSPTSVNMEIESKIYDKGTLISPNTNKALVSGEKPPKKLPIFWCEHCTSKLVTPTQAISHFNGKAHKSKVNPKESRKRTLDSDGNPVDDDGPGEEPSKKKPKPEPVDQSVHCKECDIVLNSPIMAEQHFKGKKHGSTLAKLAAAKNAPPTPTVPVPAPVNKSQYCQFCKVTLNSDGQVAQHFNGNRHKVNAGIIAKPESNQQRGGLRGGRGGERGMGGGRGRGIERGGGRGRGIGRGGEQHGGMTGYDMGGSDRMAGGRGGGGENRGGMNRGRGGEHDRGRGRGTGFDRGRGRGEATRGRGEPSRGRGDTLRGRGDSHINASRGRGDSSRGRGNASRGRGDTYRGRGDALRGRGDALRGRGDVHRGRGQVNGRGNSVARGPQQQQQGGNSQGYTWDPSSGKQDVRGRGRGSRGGGMPASGQYGNAPPAPPSSNFQQGVGKAPAVGNTHQYDNYYTSSSAQDHIKQEQPSSNYYSKAPVPNSPSVSNQTSNGYSYSSYDYYGNGQSYGSNTNSVSQTYDSAPAAADSYYSNGYRDNYSNSHGAYEHKATVSEYQMSTDAMYDSYYG